MRTDLQRRRRTAIPRTRPRADGKLPSAFRTSRVIRVGYRRIRCPRRPPPNSTMMAAVWQRAALLPSCVGARHPGASRQRSRRLQ
jgi:hypothetical protein